MEQQNSAPQFAEILLVEDNPDDEQLTMKALEDAHVANRLQVVRDGAEALDFLFSHKSKNTSALKVVLLDIKLPKVDGLEVLRQMRENPITADIPVVLLTSSAEERDVNRGYELKANSYIVKPVDFVQFTNAVKEIGAYWAVLNRPPAALNNATSSRAVIT